MGLCSGVQMAGAGGAAEGGAAAAAAPAGAGLPALPAARAETAHFLPHGPARLGKTTPSSPLRWARSPSLL